MTISAGALDEFVRKLGSADPTPGGGSASAAVGAMACGLVSMVARLTAGSKKFADSAPKATEIGAQAERLMQSLLREVDEDTAAFDGVTKAFKLPRSSEAEKAARSAAIQTALRAAAEPPMRVVEASLEACKLASALVDFGNPNAISDVGCAALFANAAAQGAALNVGINAKALTDRDAARSYSERLREALAQVDLMTEVVLGKVQAAIVDSN